MLQKMHLDVGEFLEYVYLTVSKKCLRHTRGLQDWRGELHFQLMNIYIYIYIALWNLESHYVTFFSKKKSFSFTGWHGFPLRKIYSEHTFLWISWNFSVNIREKFFSTTIKCNLIFYMSVLYRFYLYQNGQRYSKGFQIYISFRRI